MSEPIIPLTVEDIVFLHSGAIEIFGGADGIRNSGALEAAVSRPYAQFGGTQAHPAVHAQTTASSTRWWCVALITAADLSQWLREHSD